ncbi:hypothetical protein G6F61_007050 [Rhizopus arrhizus]|nr:hypothetical protein G6F65_008221 [Rhizopus arrhizus]KAG1377072.1 hypothetical protein G6F61_007050 [Rhizopus arrhizus]
MSTAESWEYPEHRQFERVPTLDQVDPSDRKDECYRTEGVNHYQSCRHLADMYLATLKTHKVEGFRKSS